MVLITLRSKLGALHVSQFLTSGEVDPAGFCNYIDIREGGAARESRQPLENEEGSREVSSSTEDGDTANHDTFL